MKGEHPACCRLFAAGTFRASERTPAYHARDPHWGGGRSQQHLRWHADNTGEWT
jgi:hypothetical protein